MVLLPSEGAAGALKVSPNSVFSSFIDEIVPLLASVSAPEMAIFPHFAEGLKPNQTPEEKQRKLSKFVISVGPR